MASIVLDLIVPGAGSAVEVLGAIFTLCCEMKESQETCVRVHGRLNDIFTELQKMEAAQQLPPSESLGRYTQTLATYVQYLTRYRAKPMHWRLMYHRKMMGELFALNEEIDMVMKLLNLTTTGAMMQWKQQWEEETAAIMGFLTQLVGNSETVLSEVRDTKAQVEAMTVLQYEINRQQGQQGEEILRMMKKMYGVIVSASTVRVPATPAWFLPETDVEYESKPFARGSFGAVHRGTWGVGTEVVVKTVLVGEGGMTDTVRTQFLNEVDIWYKLNHPHVVKMYGACHVSSPPFIVCEDATNGTLSSYLESVNGGRHQMWRLLYEAALGLDCLHKNHVVHGDLKLNNLLVGSDGKTRVADFGLSFVRSSSTSTSAEETSGANTGGLRWRAPECLDHRPTFASDIYSLAMCFIEAATGEPPFGYQDDGTVYCLVRDGKIPSKPESMSTIEWELVKSMTVFEPAKRRTLVDVIPALKTLVQQVVATASVVRPVAAVVSATVQSLQHQADGQKGDVYPVAKLGEAAALVALVSNGNDEQKENAAAALSTLAGNDRNQVEIAKAGGIPPLVALIQHGTARQKVNALSALSNLSASNENQLEMTKAGLLPALVRLVEGGIDAQKERAAALLAKLAGNTPMRMEIAQAGAIPPLVRLVESGTQVQKEKAAWALSSLAFHNGNLLDIVKAGAIPPLVRLVESGSEAQKGVAALALSSLASNSENHLKIVNAGAIPALMQLAETGTNANKEKAAKALSRLSATSK